jgi:hypothetical protein
MILRMGGHVAFTFAGVEIEDMDQDEAVHMVERMSVGELLEYADGGVDAEVTKLEVILKRRLSDGL